MITKSTTQSSQAYRKRPAGEVSRQMVTFVDESREVRVPGWVKDLPSFRTWAHKDEFPEDGRICWINGEGVWVDMSREQIVTHVAVKTEFARVLGNLAKALRIGHYYGDGLFLTNVVANIGVNPDGTFVLNESFTDGSVQLVEGKDEGYVELGGTPDMVLEVVSKSSVRKDYEWLREAYWKAGIPEYWIVDARSEPLRFDILRRGTKEYESARKSAGGWVKSSVFGKSFKLTQNRNAAGHPDYTLDVK
jgi:Uma2 family endonuclease